MKRNCESCGNGLDLLKLFGGLPVLDEFARIQPIRCPCGREYMFAHRSLAKIMSVSFSVAATGAVLAVSAAAPTNMDAALSGLPPYGKGAVLMVIFSVACLASALILVKWWPLERWKKRNS